MTAPIAFRKAAATAAEVALRAGELHNSITDGQDVSEAQLRELGVELAKHNNKRKSTVDASTAAFFFDAAGAFGAASFALYKGDRELAAAKLDEGATALESVEAHVAGLFRR